jgi:ATP-dependent helicase/nuclease subunit A
VKRRSDEGGTQVRVMTVHGAKGLEAEIVILPDTAKRREGPQPPRRAAAARRPRRLGHESRGSPAGARPGRERPPRPGRGREPAPALRRADPRPHMADRRRRRRSGQGTGGQLARPRRRGHAGPRRGVGPRRPAASSTDNWSEAAAPARRRWTKSAAAVLPGLGTRPAPPSRDRPAPLPLRVSAVLMSCTAESGVERRRCRARPRHAHPPPARGPPPAWPPDWPTSLRVCCRALPDLPDLLAEATAVLDAPELAPLFGPDSARRGRRDRAHSPNSGTDAWPGASTG